MNLLFVNHCSVSIQCEGEEYHCSVSLYRIMTSLQYTNEGN